MLTLLASVLVAGAGCTGGQNNPALRVNDIQVIGTHNSYKQPLPPEELAAHHARDPAGADSIDYGFPPLAEQLDQGIRQLELDVYADPEGGRYLHPPSALRTGFAEPPWPPAQREAMARPGFKVMHLADIDFRSSCVTWIECLRTLQRWSVAHPHHLPILILINAKDDPLGPGSAQPLRFDEAAFDRLDAQTRQVFGKDELITPDDVQGRYPTLRAALLARGWPTLEQARGKFLFVLDESPEKIAAYQGHRRSLEGRVMFVSVPESSPLASILVINDPVAQGARIAKAVAAGFLVRTRADADTREARRNDGSRHEAAFASGAQFVSTDYFDADPRFSTYRVRFPDENVVARGNPIHAPAACRKVALETLADTKPLAPADAVLRGTLTGEDNQTWHLVPFDVPAGTTRITVDFDYTTRDKHTTIDLGLLGPDGFRGQDGFRGWSGGNKRSFTVSATDATPSYLPGAIRPGTWNLLLGVPNIRGDIRAEYTANVRFEAAQTGPALRAGPGWYRGDLHMHTAHSDGSCLSQRQQRIPCPVFLTAKTASERGLDFIAITDHNTTSQADAIRELQPYFDTILLIPGREITTFHGHANLFGSLAALDFRVGSAEVPDFNALLGEIEQTDGIISINHPVRPSGEQCMGCGWTPPGPVNYGQMQAVEVVNGLDADTPLSGVGFWEHLLDQGYHLTAIGGSDNHNALQPAVQVAELRQPHDADSPSPETLAKLQRGSGAIGTPTTVIYADALSEAAIVAGIRRGRVFIDVAGTHDRSLDLTATVGKQVAHMGDTLVASRGIDVRFEGTVSDVTGGEIQVILDGRRVRLLKESHISSASSSFKFPWRADGKRHWLRVDVRDDASHLALLGNPIYLSGSAP
jgi:hypothetical protein